MQAVAKPPANEESGRKMTAAHLNFMAGESGGCQRLTDSARRNACWWPLAVLREEMSRSRAYH